MSAAPRSKRSRRSPFASALAGLLDDTNLFTRSEWAQFLRVSEPAISQWANDKTIPRADVLSAILDVLRNSSGIPGEPLAAFDAMAQKTAAQVSPLGQRMMPNVAAYLREGTFEHLGGELRKLSPTQRITALTDRSWPEVQQSEESRMRSESTVRQRAATADKRRSTGRPTYEPKGALMEDPQALGFLESIRCRVRNSRRHEAEDRHAYQ